MSTIHSTLHSIEQRAEGAIASELRLMIEQVLSLRTSSNLEDQAYADALLLKLDHLIDKQLIRPQVSGAETPKPPFLKVDPSLQVGGYELCIFHRQTGELKVRLELDSLQAALETAELRHQAEPTDQLEASWQNQQCKATIRSNRGTLLMQLRPIEGKPDVARQPLDAPPASNEVKATSLDHLVAA